MSKLKDAWAEKIEMDQRIEYERAEAAYFAVPEALHKNLEIVQAHRQESLNSYEKMRQENGELKRLLVAANSWQSKWRERAIGFTLGCCASVLASFVWLQMAKQWPLFR